MIDYSMSHGSGSEFIKFLHLNLGSTTYIQVHRTEDAHLTAVSLTFLISKVRIIIGPTL